MYSSASNLNGCSSNSIARATWGHLIKAHPDLFVYQTFPITNDDTKGGWNYIEQGDEFTRERHKLLPVHYLPIRYDQTGAGLSRELYDLFGGLRGKYVVDAVVSEAPIGTPALRKALSFYNEQKDSHVPIVHKDPFVLNADELGNVSEADSVCQSLGYALGWNIITSDYEKQLLVQEASRWLRPSVLERIIARSIVQPAGTNCDELDAILSAPDFKRYDRFTVAVVDRFTSPLNWEKALASWDSLFAGGTDLDLQITTLSKGVVQAGWDPSRYSWMRVHWGCPRHEFIKLMPRCHAFLAMSDRHSYPQGLMECLYSGLIGVFPNKRWARAVLPAEYPFWWDNVGQARQIIRWIRENYEEAQRMTAWVRPWLRETYSTQVCAEKIYAFIERAVDANREELWWPGVAGLIEKCRVRLGRRFTWEALLRAIKTFSDTGLRVGANRGMFSTTPMQVYLTSQRLGWPDTVAGELPSFDFPPDFRPRGIVGAEANGAGMAAEAGAFAGGDGPQAGVLEGTNGSLRLGHDRADQGRPSAEDETEAGVGS
jgi:glycosyltransferase involved in cell wall biosynthesis